MPFPNERKGERLKFRRKGVPKTERRYAIHARKRHDEPASMRQCHG